MPRVFQEGMKEPLMLPLLEPGADGLAGRSEMAVVSRKEVTPFMACRG
jgi:hypothetical protein